MRSLMKCLAVFLAVLTLGIGGLSAAAAGELDLISLTQGAGASPTYHWWYGCSPTAAGMMLAYYDRNGYRGLRYDNLIPGGLAELSTFPDSWSYLANNAIASTGHVSQFYNAAYGATGDDLVSTRDFDCLADFMRTSQDAVGNFNGGTTFYFLDNGRRLYARDLFNAKVTNDGMLGLDQYFRYAGYNTSTPNQDTTFYSQLVKTPLLSYGFTLDNYKTEIDAGRVVMLQLSGHSMFGYGYSGDLILFHDTWDALEHSMSWDALYSGMDLIGVTAFEPTGGLPVPLPPAWLLMISGLAALGGWRRRFRKN
jgi:hypothetical protein